MSTSAILVSIVDSSELKLVNIVGETLDDPTFITTCVTLIGEGDAPALIGQFLKQPILPTILQLPPTGTVLDDIFGIYSILLTIVKKCDDANIEGQLINALVNLLLDTPIPVPKNATPSTPKTFNPHAQARLRVLVTIYNLLTTTNDKLSLLFGILSFAEKTQQLTAIRNFFTIIPNLVTEWKLAEELKREVFIACYSALKNGQSGDEASEFVHASCNEFQDYWLETFENSTVEKFANDKDLKTATASVASRLSEPSSLFVSGSTLLNYQAVTMLSKSNPKIVALLKLFVEGNVSEFQAFDKTFLATMNLDVATCLEHMRIVSLISLCSSTVNREVTYAQIAKALQIDEKDVEEWVIKSVTLNLLQARLDQINRIVLVSKCVSQKFGKEDWVTLKEKLSSWEKNISAVVENINKSDGQEQKKQSSNYKGNRNY